MRKILFIILVIGLNLDAIAQTTSIPDPAFEIALINLGYDNFPIDGVVPTANISNVAILNVSGQLINNLTGIESFTNLLELNCSGNNLTTLNLSQNTNLGILNCGFNQLTSLNITQNIYLYSLYCSSNQLSNLNVTQNINLTQLYCANNLFTSIDVSNNTALTLLNLNNSQLTSLNVTQNTALQTLAFYNSNITSIDLSQNTNLTFLECNNNLLTSLDVTQNTSLSTINCSYNLLTNIDVTNIIGLQTLICNNNQLSSLNLTQTLGINLLDCSDNQLTCLNLKNGTNYISGLTIDATNNPMLTCIEVDDVAWSTTNWTNIDAQTLFSTNCPIYCGSPTTAIPDVNFEQALINLGYDFGVPNGFVYTSNINTLTSLSVYGLNINDLTGIEDFTALIELDCSFNQLTSLNVSQNINLIDLNCSFNQLTSLDVSQNTALVGLNCENNQISSMEVTQNTALYLVRFNDNQLTCLNVKNGNNSNLEYFYSTNNPNLTCIEVDNVAWSMTNWTNIDAQSSFSIDCNNACSFVGVDKNVLSTANIYPNPIKTVLNIVNGKGRYLITDIFGRMLTEINITTDNYQINTTGFKSGVYFITSMEDNSSIKFIKQ